MVRLNFAFTSFYISIFFSFRHPFNERVNKALVTNIKGLDGMEKISIRTIERE